MKIIPQYQNPFCILFENFKQNILNKVTLHSVHLDGDSLLEVFLNKFKENYLFNFYYFIMVGIFFFSISTDKNIKLNSRIFYFYLFIIIGNPLTIIVLTSFHTEFFGCLSYTLFYVMICRRELQLALVSLIMAYSFNPYLMEVSFV